MDIYAVAGEAAHAFMRGEIEYANAISRIEAQLDPRYRRENPDSAEMYAQELLDEQLMDLESAAFDERRFYNFVNEAAQRVMCGALDYHEALCAVKGRLGSVYVRRNPLCGRNGRTADSGRGPERYRNAFRVM